MPDVQVIYLTSVDLNDKKTLAIDLIGHRSRDVSGRLSVKSCCY